MASSAVQGSQDDNVTITDYSQSGDNVSTPTDGMLTVVPQWTHGSIGHKRSQSNTTDCSHLTNSATANAVRHRRSSSLVTSCTTNAVRHRRSSSLDVNLLLYKDTGKLLIATEVDSDSPLTISVKDVEQEEEQQEEQQQSRRTTLPPLQDEVDFSSMFGKWKGNQMTFHILRCILCLRADVMCLVILLVSISCLLLYNYTIIHKQTE